MATDAAAWAWSNGALSRSIVVRTSGAYAVWTTDVNGCIGASDSVRVIALPRPQPFISGPAGFCAGDSVVLTVQGAQGTVKWSTGATARSITVRASATLTATVKDSLGCSGDSPVFTVTRHPRPAAPVITRNGDTLFCASPHAIQWLLDGVPLAGETHPKLVITRTGEYSVQIIDSLGCGAVSPPMHAGPWVQVPCTVYIPHLTGRPGDHVLVPVIAECAEALRVAGTTSVALRISRLENILFEDASTPSGWTAAGSRLFDTVASMPGAGDTIARFPFVAMLGPIAFTPLLIDSIAFVPAQSRITTVNGSFRLITCNEGGTRLFDASSVVTLRSIGADPFNAEVVIEYAVPGAVSARLVVYDLLGRLVRVLAEGPQPAGRHRVRLDASRLASGTYLCVLTAEDLVRVLPVHVLK